MFYKEKRFKRRSGSKLHQPASEFRIVDRILWRAVLNERSRVRLSRHTHERWDGRRSQRIAALLWRRGAETRPAGLSTGYQPVRAQHATELLDRKETHSKKGDTLALCWEARRQWQLCRSLWPRHGSVAGRRQQVERRDDRA